MFKFLKFGINRVRCICLQRKAFKFASYLKAKKEICYRGILLEFVYKQDSLNTKSLWHTRRNYQIHSSKADMKGSANYSLKVAFQKTKKGRLWGVI